jgi:hypothetical protein
LNSVKQFLFTAFLSLTVATSLGQNLEAIGKAKPLKVNGGVSASQIFYAANGINNRRDPYSYFLTGNLNFSLYEFNVPLSFSLSNQNISVQQPFNQLSLHPTYKGVTAHVGFASMSFSPYTLNGHIFKGVGVDVNAMEKLKVSAMYGRLMRAVRPDSTDSRNQPSFARYGYGTKVAYNSNGNFIEVIAFKAKDDVNSLPFVPEEQNVLPQENLVLSAAGGLTFFKSLQVKYEYANSAITSDTRAAKVDKNNLYSHVGSLFTPRGTTAYYGAMKGAVNYNGDGFAIGAGYERIDPQYKTLGAYYFNNDLENITLNGAKSLFAGKVNLSASVGTQRDNLDKSKISTMRRTITSVNLAITPSPTLNINTSYSNFQTFTNIRSQFVDINQLTPYDNLDTLNFTQVSQSANATINYTLKGTENKKENLFANLNVMKASDTQANVTQNSGSTFLNFNSGYSLNLVKQNITITPTFNLSNVQSSAANSVTLGPSLSVSKTALDKKLRLTVSGNANRTYMESKFTNQVITVRTMAGYVLQKKHNLNLSLVGLSRNTSSSSNVVRFKEFTGTLAYSYSF